MPESGPASIVSLYRYPVKGMSPDRLEQIEVEIGNCFPSDRAYAIENGSRDFDPVAPRHLPKIKFLTLMRNERLASLQSKYDAETGTLTVLRDGRRVTSGQIGSPVGRQIIEQFLAAFLPDDIRGAPRLVAAEGHHFTDVEPQWLSLVNLASVRDLERVLQRPVNPLRFRANIYIDGLEAWRELDWVDRRVFLNGQPSLKGTSRITRCAATNVNPDTGDRDLAIPQALSAAFGHMDMGLYVTTTHRLSLAPGDIVTVNS